MRFAGSGWMRCVCIPMRSAPPTRTRSCWTARSSPNVWRRRASRGSAGSRDGDLVGLVGLQIRTGAKERHKARLFSMYVDAAHRGSGLAQQLIEAVIAGAREAGALVLQLSVAAGNAPAQRLYRRMGFTVYGIERRSLRVGGAVPRRGTDGARSGLMPAKIAMPISIAATKSSVRRRTRSMRARDRDNSPRAPGQVRTAARRRSDADRRAVGWQLEYLGAKWARSRLDNQALAATIQLAPESAMPSGPSC